MKKVLILYFSGVGATKKVAELMCKKVSQSCHVDIFSMENTDIPSIDNYDALIIGTPTYHAAPAKIVMHYFESIPRQTKEIPAFVFNTRGVASFNTNRLLSKKMYPKNIVTFMDRQYRSPASDGVLFAPFIKRFFEFEKDFENKVNNDCADFIELLSRNEAQGYIPGFHFGSIVNAPNKLAGHLISLKIRVHKNKCVKCGKCIEKCPQSAFSADKDGFPQYAYKKCENCYRCIHHCQKTALSLCKRRTPKKILKY